MLTRCQSICWLRGQTFFANIFAKMKNFAKLFSPIHMGSRSNLLSKKIVTNLVTLSLWHNTIFLFYFLFPKILTALTKKTFLRMSKYNFQFWPLSLTKCFTFVFFQMEPPEYAKSNTLHSNQTRYSFFNRTMTYRSDSDIIQRDLYGITIKKQVHSYRDIDHSFIKKNTF